MTDAKRVPLRVRLPFASRAEFVERYARHVAPEGIFIATKGVKAEGTALLFELVLSDGARVMRGEGTVTRVVQSEQPGQSGMLVRFERLDAPTKELVLEVVAHQQAALEEALDAGPEHPVGDAPGSAPGADDAAPPIEFSASSIQAAPPVEPTAAEVAAAPPLEPVPPLPLGSEAIVGLDVSQPAWRAAVVQSGEVHPVALGGGAGPELPAWVAVDVTGKLVAGHDAQPLAASTPDRAWGSAARWLGVRPDGPAATAALRWAGIAALSVDGALQAQLGPLTVAAADAVVATLACAREAAVPATGRPLGRVVLAVPSTFTPRQREALLSAAQRAGLQVVRLLDDTTAAALAFGHGRGLARKRVLVVKLGATGFGASVVDVTGDDVEVAAATGDPWLGGDDADAALLDALIAGLPEDTQAVARAPGRQRYTALSQVRAARRELETVEAVPLTLTLAGAQLDVTLSRELLQRTLGPSGRRAVELLRQALDGAKLTAQQIDDVVLLDGVGATADQRRELESVLGRITHTDTTGLVAAGAALAGQAIGLRERGKRAASLSDVLTAPIGWAGRDGALHRLLDRNTRLPAVKTVALPLEAGQPAAVLLCQGEGPSVAEAQPLGVLELGADGSAEVTLEIRVDADGRLAVSHRGRAGAWTASFGPVEDVLGRAPPEPERPQAPKGLLGGLKKLFGR